MTAKRDKLMAVKTTLSWIPHGDRTEACSTLCCQRRGVYLLRRSSRGRKADRQYCAMHVGRRASLLCAEPLDDQSKKAMKGVIL